MTREGGIEAPTRYPVPWKEPEFWDTEALHKELERVYDICHGCRRCVSLCQAFPTLFDLVDESETLEVDGVARDDYFKVVDQCYLCDLCYQTKCPYVPPHEWEVDFPHLMLRAKAHQFRASGASASRKVLSAPDKLGRWSSKPGIVKLVNKVNRSTGGRKLLKSTLRIHPDAHVPPVADPPLAKRVGTEDEPASEAREAGRTRGKVAVFGTCFGHYNRPEMVEDMLSVFRHNGIHTRLAPSTGCCGMPKMELGDLAAVERLKNEQLPGLLELVDGGYDIITPIPSCTLMFKQEWPLLFPEDADVARLRAHTFDPFEYLAARHKEGLLSTTFKNPLGVVSYHVPCHQRVQNIGPKTRDILALVPDTEIKTVERCSGHDGSYGVRVETFENAARIGRPVVRQLNRHEAQHVSSDCPLAGDHLAHLNGSGEARHPISLLRYAYGI
ncbi:MAG: heterodisulfide reductase-related iron-sulfur binding cluster [Xanthomonadales bacterium]|nr:heterodisulfide reductase-related iron-sulfur binding cluster [Xanthomonadales bacterium]